MKGLDAARLQRTILLYSVAVMIALALAVATASLWPLYRAMAESADAHLLGQLSMKATTTQEVLNRARSLVRQTTSRSAIRDALADYNEGRSSLAQLQAFTADKLGDSLRLSAEILGITRLSREGDLVVIAGLAVPPELWPIMPSLPASVTGQPRELAGRTLLLLDEPIVGRDQSFEGTDLLLFDASALRHLVEDRRELGAEGEVMLGVSRPGGTRLFFPRRLADSSAMILPPGSPLDTAFRHAGEGGEAVLHLPAENGRGRDAVAIRPLQGSDWIVGIRMPEDELYYDVDHLLNRVGLVVAGLVVLATAGLVVLLRPLTGKILVRTGELSRQVTELAEIGRRLEQSNEELAQFATIVAHDLQEPLRAIGGYVQLIKRRYAGKLDADADQFIGFVVSGAARLHRLLNDLLRYQMVDRTLHERRPVDLNEAWSHAVARLQPRITEAGATVTAAALPQVTGCADDFEKIFLELLDNAVKFHAPERPVRIQASAQCRPEGWLVTVADNGIGIDPAYLESIFVPCTRLHPRDRYVGTGMGLAIARKITQTFGGTLWASATPGEGSRFHLLIPLRDEA